MLWSQDWIKPRLGYSRTSGIQRDIYSLTLNAPGKPSTYKFHDVVGNTKYKGRWSWKLAGDVNNNDAKCYDWYNSQPSTSVTNLIRNHGRSDCPCLLAQVLFDRRYRFSSFKSNSICYKQRATWFFIGSSISYHTTCCYSLVDRFLINDIDPEVGILTQKFITQKYNWISLLFSSRIRRISRRQSVIDDTTAFGYCCQQSSLCHLYAEKRPVPTCRRYLPPIMCKPIFNMSVYPFLPC